MDLVSQRADERKPLGHRSLPHFPRTPILVQIRILGFRSVDVSLVFVFDFRRILSQHTTVDSISCSTLCNALYTVQQGTQVQQILFTWVMTPALKSVGQVTDSCWMTLPDFVIVIVIVIVLHKLCHDQQGRWWDAGNVTTMETGVRPHSFNLQVSVHKNISTFVVAVFGRRDEDQYWLTPCMARNT